MEEKIPCIRCNKDKWNRIKPYLVKWGYNIDGIEETHNWAVYPILSINRRGKMGNCVNTTEYNTRLYNRSMITDTNEFLTKAASLMGFEYPDKIDDEIELRNGVILKIKSGMVIEGLDYNDIPQSVVVFPMSSTLAFIPIGIGYWNRDIYAILKEVTCVKDITPSSSPRLGGNVIWEKLNIIELTMDEALKEIADKRGVKVEQIKIKQNE